MSNTIIKADNKRMTFHSPLFLTRTGTLETEIEFSLTLSHPFFSRKSQNSYNVSAAAMSRQNTFSSPPHLPTHQGAPPPNHHPFRSSTSRGVLRLCVITSTQL